MVDYIQLESSTHESQPFEFFQFTAGAVEYLYTSSDFDITYQGKNYRRAAISRGEIEGTSDPDKGVLRLQVPYSLPLMEQLIRISPSTPIELTVWRAQRINYSFQAEQVVAIWIGRVHGCEIHQQVVALTCISILNSQYRMGNTLKWQKACGYSLYESYNCRVNPNNFSLPVVIQAENVVSTVKIRSPSLIWGFTLPVQATGDHEYLKVGWFIGGYIEYHDSFSNTIGKRAITGYDWATGTVTVFPPIRGMAPGQEVLFYAGCKHTSKDCQEKFGNIVNCGSDPFIPIQDPYDPFERFF